MAKTYTHPHWDENVIDKSIYTPLVREQLPTMLPIFFMRAQQGREGVPVYVSSYNAALKEFGEGTFDDNTKYFSREAVFLKGLFERQGAFITRMVAGDAAAGSLVLELKVKKANIPQYERDDNGQFVLDEETGDKIPLRDASTNAQITEPGLELTWSTRALNTAAERPETITNLKPTTHGTGDDAYTVYPILAVKAKSVGAYANDIGVKLYVDLDNPDTTLATAVGALPMSFGIVKKTYGQDTVSPVVSKYENQFETFVAKPDQIDERFESAVSFKEVIEDNYPDIPFDVQLYTENIETVGAAIKEVEPDDDTLTDPFMANIIEPYNIDDVPMVHVALSEDSIRLGTDRICYMTGGEDGTMDDENIEALTRQWLNDLLFPAIRDSARYPFSAMFDTGVSLATKRAMIRFMGVRKDFRLYLATQDCNLETWNTEAQDQSVGASLYAACLLQPESQLKGTVAFRADIYAQAGHLANSKYRKLIPFVYDIMMKKSRYASTGTVTGQPAGLPRSEVSVFKDWNWTPTNPDLKQIAWENGINYAQYFDMDGIHWPALRTVYKYDTSVLSGSLFADIVVYIKHLARRNWAQFVGTDDPFTSFKAAAERALLNSISAMTANRYNVTVEYSQTEEEAKIGYISHCDISITGRAQNRITKFNIICYREGYSSEEE